MKFAESKNVELKMLINTDFKKEIVAFANTDGGSIYVGINDDGEVIGVENIEKEMERISSMIRDSIKPDLIPFTDIEAMTVNGKKVICVNVSRGGKRPYYIAEKGMKSSGVYVRHGIVSAPASDAMIREMIKQSDDVSYDKMRSLNQNLTFKYTEEYFLERGISFSYENKRTLGLIDSDGLYTNAALLLSDQCEHSVKCAVFEDDTKFRFKTREEFSGSILKQLEESYKFISMFNHVHSDFVDLSRVDTFDYPKYALREALINSIIHRDYDYSGSIIINVFDDRIEFVSIGGLVQGITVTDIMYGVSQSRNTLIANVFYRLELIESYGTGIQRIIQSYKGSKQPEFKIGQASFVTVLPNRTYKEVDLSKNKFMTDEEKVLEMLAVKKSITRKDVEELLGTSSFPANKVLRSLIKDNKIIQIGSARNTRYILKEN